MRGRGRVFGLSVCLFVHHFLACLCVRGIFKVSIYAWQVDVLIKVARRWSAIERDVLEARKTLVKLKHRYAPFCRSAIRTSKRHGRMRTLSSNCMDWYGRMRTLTRRVHPWKRKYGSKRPRQKQLSIALQRIDSKKPRLCQLSTDLSRSGLPGVQFPLGIVASCVFTFKYLMYTL